RPSSPRLPRRPFPPPPWPPPAACPAAYRAALRPPVRGSGLGHDQELEPVEALGVLAEIGRHHLDRLALGLAGLVTDGRLSALERACGLLAAALRLRRLLAHAPERRDDLLVVDHLRHRRRRAPWPPWRDPSPPPAR